MSGAGRKSQYRKGVENSFLYGLPVPEANEFIMQITDTRYCTPSTLKLLKSHSFRGSNIFEVRSPSGVTELTLLPKKFHKLIWVKRGEYVIVLREVDEKVEETSSKVRSVIQHVLTREQIRHLERLNLWPTEFESTKNSQRASYTSEDLLPDLDENEVDEGDDEVDDGHETEDG